MANTFDWVEIRASDRVGAKITPSLNADHSPHRRRRGNHPLAIDPLLGR